MPYTSIHVVPHVGVWGVRWAGEEKPHKMFPTQKAAEDYAREESKKRGAELIIHDKDGKIRDRDSHGNDPRNIPG